MSSSLAVIVDFDGTTTEEDVGGKVLTAFADPGWEPGLERLKNGEWTHRQFWAFSISHLAPGHDDEIADLAVRLARIRSGFREFVEFATRGQIAVEIASGGMVEYVSAILDAAGYPGLPRFAPGVGHDQNGRGVLTFEGGAAECRTTSLCKCDRIWKHRARGRRVVMVGDGLSDICAAKQADYVIARASLAEACTQMEIAFMPFESFFDVIEAIESLKL